MRGVTTSGSAQAHASRPICLRDRSAVSRRLCVAAAGSPFRVVGWSMIQRGFWQLELVSDDELQGELSRLLAAGARTEARIVAHLAEVDARKLHLAMGASSLFGYCLTRLGLSNNEAFHRITAARLGRRFPVIFELLERRELHLTAVCLLRDYLTADNHAELLAAATHKTKAQIELLLAQRFPRAAVPESLRKVQVLEPLSDEQYHLHLTLSRAAKEKLLRARDLLSHANPTAELSVVVERALDSLLERLERARFARTKSLMTTGRAPSEELPESGEPGAPFDGEPSPSMSLSARGARKRLPNELRREVVRRDGAQCTFIGSDDRRCDARSHLQFHHDVPWALGGTDDADNIRLLCRAHNLLVCEHELGAEQVAVKVATSRRKSAA